MSDFPPEILFDILSRLPPKDLIRFLCVSKAWNALIRHHRFVEAHLQRSIQTNSFRTILLESEDGFLPSDFFSSAFDDSETFGPVVKIEQPLKCPDDYTEILGCSDNGVVCIHNGIRGDLALWNPSIQKFKKIPLPTFEIEQRPSSFGVIPEYGFGYDSANHDYKILAIVNSHRRDDATVSSQVSIYSLKFNSWKRIPKLPCDGFYVQTGDVVFLNGAMSCLMRKSDSDKNRCKILALDLASEKYREFGTPVGDEDDNFMMSLEVLGGSLCICVHQFWPKCDIWIMKEYGVTKSWTLLYSIEDEGMSYANRYCKPLVFSKKGEMVVLVNIKRTTFFRCDLKKKRAKQVRICGLPTFFDGTICVGSLSLLDNDHMTVERQQNLERGTQNITHRDGPRLGRLRLQNKQPKLFEGFKFYFMGDFIPSYKGYLQELVIAAGGTILQRKPVPEGRKALSVGSPKCQTFIIYSLELPDQCHCSKKSTIFNTRQADAKALATSAGAKAASNS